MLVLQLALPKMTVGIINSVYKHTLEFSRNTHFLNTIEQNDLWYCKLHFISIAEKKCKHVVCDDNDNVEVKNIYHV